VCRVVPFCSWWCGALLFMVIHAEEAALATVDENSQKVAVERGTIAQAGLVTLSPGGRKQ
jgi:hypothetical protein